MQSRFLQLQDWLKVIFAGQELALSPLIGDASFRQYYRLLVDESSYIVMDAPLDKEKPDAFFRLTRLLRYFKLNTPECYGYNQELGFLVLEDFGDTQLYQLAQQGDLKDYPNILSLLEKFCAVERSLVPNYEASKLSSEIDVMSVWFYRWLDLPQTLITHSRAMYEAFKQLLVDSAITQPKVFVYRDFHSKNIMVTTSGELGLIDFQDAVNGPITYDLVSILKDCYLSLDKSFIEAAVKYYYDYVSAKGLLNENTEFKVFRQWFDLMGLQRHLKCLGIFTRQQIQNNNSYYLRYLPRVMKYIDEVCEKYDILREFKDFWQQEIKPRYKQKASMLIDTI